MNESPIRKFCESSHRNLIVVIVTTLVGLLVLIPMVDDYFDKKESRRALVEELDHARKTAKALPALEERVAKLTAVMRQFEERSVSQQSLSLYRSKLVEMIRDSGCQVRRLDVGNPKRRPWRINDNPLEKSAGAGSAASKTPFLLERRDVALTVDGSMDNIRELLERLYKDKTFAYPQQLNLHGISRRGGSVTLDLELWLFALSRNQVS